MANLFRRITIQQMLVHLGLFLLSAATLAFEINLTRLFSVAQFYHFAFMIVSLALLGFGASGSALALFPRWGRREPERTLGWLALGFAASAVGSTLLTNALPFDSFSITWDRRQVAILALHYVALAIPFFFSGTVVGLLLAARPGAASRTYFVNLSGSACGCVVVLAVAGALHGEGVVMLCGILGGVAALLFLGAFRERKRRDDSRIEGSVPRDQFLAVLSGGLLALILIVLVLKPGFTELRLSPYKDLSYALNVPGAEVLSRKWNAFSRVDLVDSPAIRSLPGLSYRYTGLPPRQRGLTVDGGDLSGIVVDLDALGFAAYVPGALAYVLRPAADALVLEPRGGLDVLIAHGLGANTVTAVEPNPLVVDAADLVYGLPGVKTAVESGRSFARRMNGQTDTRYDVVTLSLTAPYRPVRSGAYSLAEDYAYTVEAFEDYVALLKPGGVFQVTRWLQSPPSEETRLFALAVAALERRQIDPNQALVYFRGYNTATTLIRPDGFTPVELEEIRQWLAQRAFDLVYAPDVQRDEVNRYNVLQTPDYYQAALGLLSAPNRESWFDEYAFDVRPPTDDHPFFGHFFKWRQAAQILQEAGQTWQPFGGAGYFVLLAVLSLAAVAAGAIILLPLVAGRLTGRLVGRSEPSELSGRRRVLALALAYFAFIGLGYLLVEIPLIQRFILFLGQPIYGLTVVLFSLLFFSGVGSLASARLPIRATLGALVVVVLAYPWLLPHLFGLFLGSALVLRLVVAALALAPLGFFLGVPFPRGVAWLERRAPDLIPWAWGVNGAASVIASVGAALLALSFGFSWVLVVGALCYCGAWAIALTQRER